MFSDPLDVCQLVVHQTEPHHSSVEESKRGWEGWRERLAEERRRIRGFGVSSQSWLSDSSVSGCLQLAFWTSQRSSAEERQRHPQASDRHGDPDGTSSEEHALDTLRETHHGTAVFYWTLYRHHCLVSFSNTLQWASLVINAWVHVLTDQEQFIC